MTEKEKQAQEALGTMKRQMLVQSGGPNPLEELLDGFRKAIKNFGLLMYDEPDMDEYAFIISNEKLTNQQLKESFLTLRE